MHKNEVIINEELICYLLNSIDFRFSKLVEINPNGTDNRAFKIDEDFIIRLPRTKNSSEVMRYEQKALSSLQFSSSVKIPQIKHKGSPSSIYPFFYTIYNWIEGEDLYHSKSFNSQLLAIDLANFINNLQNAKHEGLVFQGRGMGLFASNDDFLRALQSFDEDINKKQKILSLWENLLKVPNYSGKPRVIHTDILPMNIIIKDGKLNSVIDFSYIGLGDPSADLLPAFAIFGQKEREVFFDNLDINRDAILRGVGVALDFAVQAIPYYKNTNKVIYEIAMKTLKEVLLYANLD